MASATHGQWAKSAIVGLLSDRAGPTERPVLPRPLLWRESSSSALTGCHWRTSRRCPICSGELTTFVKELTPRYPTVLSALPGSGRRRSWSPVVRPPQTAMDKRDTMGLPGCARTHSWNHLESRQWRSPVATEPARPWTPQSRSVPGLLRPRALLLHHSGRHPEEPRSSTHPGGTGPGRRWTK